MSMTAVIESIERDALRKAMKPEIEMSLVEFAEKIAPFPLSEFQKQLINEYAEHRCQRCNRLLGKFNGQAEIKCPKCGEINRIGVE